MIKNKVGLKKVEKDIEKLTPQEQLQLMEKIAYLLRKSITPGGKKNNWNRIYGIGKGLWQGEDAQEYVNRLREDRR